MGLRGWLRTSLMSGATEIEPKQPGSKVSAYSSFLSSVFSDTNYVVGTLDTCPKEIK